MQQEIDHAKMEAFIGKVVADTSGLTVTILASIGDRLNLFKNLAHGPATSEQLANRANINERYAREWLGAMACAGYVEYDPESGRFTLPAEHLPALAQENGPVFFGGAHQMLMGMIAQYEAIIQAFQHGGGVPQSAYNQDVWVGMERFTGNSIENFLISDWIGSMPEVRTKLENGAHVADIGCGHGRALIKLAEAFPTSSYVGFDIFEPLVAGAVARAQEAGVADRIQFQTLDSSQGLPEQYDLITTFDVVHDSADPMGLLRSIYNGLRPGGKYICLEINSSHNLEENIGHVGAFFHGISILYCMTTSLANHGAGLGTVGVPEKKLREMCAETGFRSVRVVPSPDPFGLVYEVTR